MSLKAQLEVCRREYEANAEPHVVDAARCSIQVLAETSLVANAVKAGETAPLQSSLMRAVLFSALTTATAFGALWLSNHPGTASMGRLLMISLGWEILVTLLFRPALLAQPPKATRR